VLHKLNLAGHLPEIIFNICAKKMTSFETAAFEKDFLVRNSSQSLD
jgi:hypothetical protein